MDIVELLRYCYTSNASDLHLSSGMVPLVRIYDELQEVQGFSVLDENVILKMLNEILPPQIIGQLQTNRDIDCAIYIPQISRFRVNVFQQYRGISAAFRTIPIKIPTIAELELPDIFYTLCDRHNGLVLVTGPTGSGKTTSQAAMIDHINNTQRSHIITIEDPIEYVHEYKKSLIQQREVNKHVESFEIALRATLREDPDYILVGEMRDLETIRLALTAAETGHLVFATLHTNSAAETIDRIIDVFPSHEKTLIRAMLANSLQAVISQILVKRVGGGCIAAHEIMLSTSGIRNMIRENKIPQLYSALQTGQERGMHTLDQNLLELLQRGIINKKEYDFYVRNP
jgi:twitching motility protein PilT